MTRLSSTVARRALAAVLCGVVLLAGAVPVDADDHLASGDQDSATHVGDESLSSARNIRETFHLDSSDDAIDTASRSTQPVDFLGTVLTVEENEQVQRQLALERHLDDVGDEISAVVGPNFAGTWVDRETRSVVVALKGDLDTQSRDVISGVVQDAEIEVRQVPRSLSDLREISGLVSAESDSYVVRSVGREPMANRVVIDVTGDVDAATREMQERFGDAVEVSELNAQAVSRTSGPPWGGWQEDHRTDL